MLPTIFEHQPRLISRGAKVQQIVRALNGRYKVASGSRGPQAENWPVPNNR